MLYVSEQGKLYILMDYCDGGNSFWVVCVMVPTLFISLTKLWHQHWAELS